MKKNFLPITSTLVLALFACGLVLGGPIGCPTTPAKTAYKIDVATVTGANAAFIGWKKYLEVQEAEQIKLKHAGQDVTAATAKLHDQWVQANDLWDKYVLAQNVAFSASKALVVNTNTSNGVELALAAATAAENDFIAFVKSLTK